MAAKKKPAVASKKRAATTISVTKPVDPEIARLERLLTLMREHGLAELEIAAAGGDLVRLSKYASSMPANPSASGAIVAAPSVAPLAAPAVVAPAATAGDKFLSPMVGTFYKSPSPEAKPFVAMGDSVKADTVLCIIEAMKVMNEIRAEKPGKVVQILVENGEAVEYGQPLFIVQRS